MMVSLLRPGKNGNQILDLLDKVTTTFATDATSTDFDDEDESVEYEELSINF